ncbi:hypothetical protein CEXT_459181 [Caerostris extrusa]|uniref:Uncharacterized protein n=1 Tax=Caerostris extrusa TaxID=172846 RepID=A0AAV4QEC1_CAEEX|nr:hypothetical protein CEXT_459181 [Caerostris extrusa]
MRRVRIGNPDEEDCVRRDGSRREPSFLDPLVQVIVISSHRATWTGESDECCSELLVGTMHNEEEGKEGLLHPVRDNRPIGHCSDTSTCTDMGEGRRFASPCAFIEPHRPF